MDGHGDGLGASAPYGRLEYIYYEMATAAGIEMSPCLLLEEGPRRHFMTKRFDRGPGTERIHMISLCALSHLDFKMKAAHTYDQLFMALDALGLGDAAREQAYRRMVFNVAANNNDDHTKNFAFLRRRTGDWELSPAYDVTHAYNPEGEWTYQHQMAVNAHFTDITRHDLIAVGERNKVPDVRKLTKEVLEIVDEWPAFAGTLVDPDYVARVDADLKVHRPR
jgi:serine/threonine-protein kinase HipA